MAVIFPQTKGAGERFGEALGQVGSGLGSGFQALANMKMQDYMNRQQMALQQEQMRYQQGLQREQQQYQQGIQQKNNLQTLMAMGYPQEKAQQMASTDPALLKEIIKYDMQQKGNEPLAQTIASMFGGNQQNIQQEPMQGGEQLQTKPTISAEQLKAVPRHDLLQTAQMLGKRQQHAEDLAFKKEQALEKGGREEQKQLKTFLDEDRKKFQGLKKQKEIAEEMLNIVNNYKGKFPGAIMGNLPDTFKKMWITDPKVRRFMQLQAELVRTSAEKGGGRASKYLYQLAEQGKTGVGQPIETIQTALKNYIDEYGQSKDKERFKTTLKNKKTGRYPVDLPDRLAEYDMAQEDPLNYPQYYANGTVYEDDNGKQFILKNGEWKDK